MTHRTNKQENEMRNAIAYGIIGKLASRLLAATVFTKSRPHWIRDWFAGYKTLNELK
jgi:hypothetical protein